MNAERLILDRVIRADGAPVSREVLAVHLDTIPDPELSAAIARLHTRGMLRREPGVSGWLLGDQAVRIADRAARNDRLELIASRIVPGALLVAFGAVLVAIMALTA